MVINPAHYASIKQALGVSSVFSNLPDDVFKSMFETFRRTSWKKGVIADPDALTKEFFILIHGRVSIEAIDATSGKSFTSSILGPGDGFDIITLLDNQPHDVVTTALEELDLLHAPVKTVRIWIRQHPEFNKNFMPYLARKMRELEGITTNLATSDTATRLARLILTHTHESRDAKADHSVHLIHDMSHEAIGHMLGSTRQVINKHIQALRRSQVLDVNTKQLKVKNLAALKKLAQGFVHHQS